MRVNSKPPLKYTWRRILKLKCSWSSKLGRRFPQCFFYKNVPNFSVFSFFYICNLFSLPFYYSGLNSSDFLQRSLPLTTLANKPLHSFSLMLLTVCCLQHVCISAWNYLIYGNFNFLSRYTKMYVPGRYMISMLIFLVPKTRCKNIPFSLCLFLSLSFWWQIVR